MSVALGQKLNMDFERLNKDIELFPQVHPDHPGYENHTQRGFTSCNA